MGAGTDEPVFPVTQRVAVIVCSAVVLAALAALAFLTPRVMQDLQVAASEVDQSVRGPDADGYSRAEFGKAWADVDGNGCDTRNDILARDLIDEVLAADGCTVLSGTLTDPYTGQTVQFVRGPGYQPVQIDHVRSLHDAWHAGADGWTAEQRLLFANDPSNLLATTLNLAKGDSDPSELEAKQANLDLKWKPTPAGECRFAAAFSLASVEWQLPIEADDVEPLSGMLRPC